MAERLSVERLKKRRDFLLAAKARRASRRAVSVEYRVRGDVAAPRVGFTVTKRVARKAVERNRIRRRLREAVRLGGVVEFSAGCDYVLVGRRPALEQAFSVLRRDLASALGEVQRPAIMPGSRREGAAPRSSSR